MISLTQGDVFQAFDGDEIVEHEDGKKTFVAKSDPLVEDGLLCIEVQTC